MASQVEMGPYLQPVQLVTREKFAKEVGVSLDVVQGWIRRGYVPTVPMGKYQLINLLVLNQRLLDTDFNFQNEDGE